jgi:integrase
LLVDNPTKSATAFKNQASFAPEWHFGEAQVSPFPGETDFLFPSIRKNGTQPLTPDMILKRVIRPAAKAAGIGKRIGWHTFRHSLATNLRGLGVDIKVAQELLRHANSRITLDIYTQAVSSEKALANGRATELLLAGTFSTLTAPSVLEGEPLSN